MYVEERDNNCQFQGYISQTVTQFENRECRICRHTKWSAPWAFLISAKRRCSRKSEMRLPFLVTTIQNMVLVILHQLYTIKAEKRAAGNFFASTLAKHIFCSSANRLTASTDTRL